MKHLIFLRGTFPSLDPEMQYRYLERIGILTDRDLRDMRENLVPDFIHEAALQDCELMLI